MQIAGVSASTSQLALSSSSSQTTKSKGGQRKGSITGILIAGGSEKIAKFLRRTHSAGCSKEVPSYALFLREKSPVS